MLEKLKNEVGLLNEFHYYNIGYLESRIEDGLVTYSYSEENSGSIDIATYKPASNRLEFSSLGEFTSYCFEIKDYEDVCEEIQNDVSRIRQILKKD